MAIQNEIKRLKDLGHNKSEVSRILGINRETVRKYWQTTEALEEIDTPDWVNEIDWDRINHDINSKVPKKILYEELIETNELPSYQAFCQYIRNNIKEDSKAKVVVKIERTPGDSIEVDYSGDTVQIISPATGEIKTVELFVGCLSYSGYMFAEFTLSQKLEDFINSHNNMFKYFGGVTRYIIPDNCKTAVTKTDKYDPLVNRTYHDMCVHYNIAVDPADSYSPRHKPNVEKAVHVIQQGFFPRIRKKTYTSLYELNRDLKEWLKKKNHESMKNRGHSRNYFYNLEKDQLKDLPASSYEICHFKKAKVHPDCHIQHQRNFYSVPYKYVGKEVDVKFNSKIIHVFYETKRIASHSILMGHTHYSTIPEHYPEEKVVKINYHLSQARLKAIKIGPNMEALIERLIRMDKFPLKTLRKVQGVLGLNSSFSNEALDYGAELCLDFNKLTYQGLKNYAKHYRPREKKVSQAPIRDLSLICLQGGKNE